MIDERDGSFLCVLNDGSLEWQALKSEDYGVKKFNEARKASDETANIINAEQWAKG